MIQLQFVQQVGSPARPHVAGRYEVAQLPQVGPTFFTTVDVVPVQILLEFARHYICYICYITSTMLSPA